MTSLNQRGVTLIELVVATAVTAMLVIIIGQFVGNSLFFSSREDTQTVLQSNTKGAVESVATAVREAKRVEATNTLPDANAPGNQYGWTVTSPATASLILGVPARDSNNNLLYIDGQHTNIYLDEYVYYIDPTTSILYKRVIRNPNTGLDGNVSAAVTTCPSASASSSCPADPKVVSDVAQLNTVYYDSNNNIVTTPTGTEAVQITLVQTHKAGKQTLSSSFTTIVAMRNK